MAWVTVMVGINGILVETRGNDSTVLLVTNGEGDRQALR